MNKYYLVHSFTKHFGCSPISYLNDKRIEESKNLLETTNHSIAAIASMIGFPRNLTSHNLLRKILL